MKMSENLRHERFDGLALAGWAARSGLCFETERPNPLARLRHLQTTPVTQATWIDGRLSYRMQDDGGKDDQKGP